MNFFNFLFSSKDKNKSSSDKDIVPNNQIVENSTTDNSEIIQTIKTIWDYEILFLRGLHNFRVCELSLLTTKYIDGQEKAEILIDNFKEIGFFKDF